MLFIKKLKPSLNTQMYSVCEKLSVFKLVAFSLLLLPIIISNHYSYWYLKIL